MKGSLSFILVQCAAYAFSQNPATDSLSAVKVSYGNKGFNFTTRDNKFSLNLESRLQFRFAFPGDQDPLTFDDFDQEKTAVFKINRARLKVGGIAFKPWFEYYWEYELSQGNLLDFRIMIEKWSWLSFKLGQWKVEYTRERFVSSGKQLMVDRSIINRPFTVDRQQGVSIYGRLGKGTLHDFNYWVGAFTGNGRGISMSDDENLMYFGKLQWNFLGRTVSFSGSDDTYSEKAAASVALAAITNRSPYTRFSSAGGGELEGYYREETGDFTVNGANAEFALKRRGLSIAGEYHWKEIIDHHSADSTSAFTGFYLQGGYFFHELIDWWPRPLEMAARHATVFPGNDEQNQREWSMAFNWFFNGQRNKLTLETSYFEFEDLAFQPQDEWRFRVQWDVSF